MEEQRILLVGLTWLLSVLVVWSQSSVVAVGYEFTRITYFSYLKPSHDFSCWWCTFEFLLSWICVMPIRWLPCGFWFNIVVPEFIPHDNVWWETSCPVLYWFQRSWKIALCAFFCACINIHYINDYISWNGQILL